MLNKLLKYDIRYCSPWFLMSYAALLVFALIGRGMLALTSLSNWLILPYGLFTLLFYIMVCASSVLMLVIPAIHFYKSLLRDEGYLSFTLPVKPMELVWSKILTGCLFSLITVFVIIGSIAIQYAGTEFMDTVIKTFSRIFGIIGTGNLISMLIIAGITTIVSCFFSYITIYACFALGQLSNNHKLLFSFVAYLGVSMIMQFVNSIASVVLSLNTAQNTSADIISDNAAEVTSGVRFFNSYVGVYGGIMLVMTVALYFILRHIMTKKLNLE